MTRYFLLFILAFYHLQASAENWFEGSSPLINAHQMLLDDRLDESFSSLIQVWQSKSHDPYMQAHLNDLLLKALEKDCGKSLSNQPLAEWLNEVIVRRQSVQSPGRITHRLVVDVTSDENISEIDFVKWPNDSISRDSELSTLKVPNKTIQRNIFALNQRLAKGLYKLTIKSGNSDKIWESWIVMGEAAAKQVVRWNSKDTWAVDKFGLLNPYCSLPQMDVALYDYVDDQYKQVWQRSYESRYPKRLPRAKYKADRYVLAVSITHKRWQGAIMIEEQQSISKTYDISEE